MRIAPMPSAPDHSLDVSTTNTVETNVEMNSTINSTLPRDLKQYPDLSKQTQMDKDLQLPTNKSILVQDNKSKKVQFLPDVNIINVAPVKQQI